MAGEKSRRGLETPDFSKPSAAPPFFSVHFVRQFHSHYRPGMRRKAGGRLEYTFLRAGTGAARSSSEIWEDLRPGRAV